ncbi:hypothetical protein HK102_010621, partial [Quaeritorhiza haematococci]
MEALENTTMDVFIILAQSFGVGDRRLKDEDGEVDVDAKVLEAWQRHRENRDLSARNMVVYGRCILQVADCTKITNNTTNNNINVNKNNNNNIANELPLEIWMHILRYIAPHCSTPEFAVISRVLASRKNESKDVSRWRLIDFLDWMPEDSSGGKMHVLYTMCLACSEE